MDFFLLFLKDLLFFYNEIAIYLLLGFVVAGLLYVIFPESLIRRHLGKDNFLSVLKATAIGIPLPLCSCGVIPVAASLRRSGASKGATLSFLVSTPQIGADSFLITYSLLGWIFALFRIVAALITSLLVGFIVNLTDRNTPKASDPVFPVASLPEESLRDRLRNLPTQIVFNILGPIANPLLIGLLIAGLISSLVPDWIFARYLSNHWLSMGFMLLVGIPMYVCASASTPIAASLVFKGVSPGAALVFLLTGPATNTVTIVSVAKSLGKRAAVIYLSGIAVVSLGLGALLDYSAASAVVRQMAQCRHDSMTTSWWNLFGSAAIAMMFLIYYVKIKWMRRASKLSEDVREMKQTLQVEGMTCQHCAATVMKSVKQTAGTENVLVDLEKKQVEFELKDSAKLASIKDAIRSAGYDVK